MKLSPGETGRIESPGFPDAYPANIYCQFLISVPSDYRIKLTSNATFDVEYSKDCRDDYLHIGNNFNFINRKSLTSQIFCGDRPPEYFVSRHSELWILFKSDYKGYNHGFSLLYTVLPKGKNSLISSIQNGSFSTFGFFCRIFGTTITGFCTIMAEPKIRQKTPKVLKPPFCILLSYINTFWWSMYTL